MAILYGTTDNGTTLPVLVDQFGNLLAKGIDGAEGPPGPPGIGQLPEDPFEGAILGWEDGELSWLGGSVPLPAGTYGPFIYSDSEGTLTVPQDVSSLVNGQQLIMTDIEGNSTSAFVETSQITNVNGNVLSFVDNSNFDLFYEGQVVQPGVGILNISGSSSPPKITVTGGSWYGADGTGDEGDGRYEPTKEWSSYVTGTPFSGNTTAAQAFDGDPRGGQGAPVWACFAADGNTMTFRPPTTITAASQIRISACQFGTQSKLMLNGVDITDSVSLTSVCSWVLLPVNTIDSVNGLSWSCVSGSAQDHRVSAIEVDGKILIDSSVPGGQGATKISKNESGTGSVLTGAGNTIVLRNNNREWIDDYYVTAPEQRIAARKVATAAIRRKTN